jgi:hypothetical protein
VLHAAIGSDDALLNFIAPHFAVNKFPQEMRVDNCKLCRRNDEQENQRLVRGNDQGNETRVLPPAMTRRTKILDWTQC